MPAMDVAEKAKSLSIARKIVAIMPIATTVIGVGLAAAIFKGGDNAGYSARIAEAAAKQAHWAFFSGGIFHKLVQVLNMYPMLYKSQCMRNKSGNLRANPIIYAPRVGKGSKVTMVDDGEVGRMNRANRSLHHFVENSIPMAVNIVLASTVFPFPAFVCTCVFALGRVLHQVGYSSEKGYGNHGAGFMLSSMAMETMCGLLLIAGFKGVMG